MIEFDRFVAVINPESSQAAKVVPRIENLREHYPVAYEEIWTTEDAEATTANIVNKLQPGDLCLNAGGDGTEYVIMHAQLESGLEVPMLSLWGGNGNDKAHMLNGNPPLAAHTHELLRRGEVVAIHPIEIALAGLKTKLAGNYTGFGATADGAAILNQKSYRHRRGYNLRPVRASYEAAALLPAPLQAEPFPYRDNAGEHTAIDITFANGNRMAKYGRTSARLTEKEIFRTVCGSRNQAPGWFARLATGQARGEKLHWGEQYSFQIGKTILGHVDAETFTVERGTAITARIHANPFHAVSTKHR